MFRLTLSLACAALLAPLNLGCGKDASSPSGPELPEVVPSQFVPTITNRYFPLEPGTTFVYEGRNGDDELERVEFEVTSETKKILGVTCVVVHDRAFVDGELEEDTFDWFAQHENGDIWYFGEDTKEIDNGRVVSTEGSWQAGVDGARAGILIQGTPVVGASYHQEYYKGEAEDMASVVRTDVSVAVRQGAYVDCLQTREWTPLEPGVAEYKYYAPGVGLIKEEMAQGGTGGLELVEIRTK